MIRSSLGRTYKMHRPPSASDLRPPTSESNDVDLSEVSRKRLVDTLSTTYHEGSFEDMVPSRVRLPTTDTARHGNVSKLCHCVYEVRPGVRSSRPVSPLVFLRVPERYYLDFRSPLLSEIVCTRISLTSGV